MTDSLIMNRDGMMDEVSRKNQVVCISISKEYFGVPILMVQEILRSANIIPLPNSPDFLEGVINLRGSLVPIVDLRKRIGWYGKDSVDDDEIWILILNIEGRITGFIVDSVIQVFKYNEKRLKHPSESLLDRIPSPYVEYEVKIDQVTLILLDFHNLLTADDFKKIKKAINA